MREEEVAVHSLAEDSVDLVGDPVWPDEVPLSREQILEHARFHATLDQKPWWRRRHDHEVDHKAVQQACRALAERRNLARIGDRPVHPWHWLRVHDPDWLMVEEQTQEASTAKNRRPGEITSFSSRGSKRPDQQPRSA